MRPLICDPGAGVRFSNPAKGLFGVLALEHRAGYCKTLAYVHSQFSAKEKPPTVLKQSAA